MIKLKVEIRRDGEILRITEAESYYKGDQLIFRFQGNGIIKDENIIIDLNNNRKYKIIDAHPSWFEYYSSL